MSRTVPSTAERNRAIAIPESQVSRSAAGRGRWAWVRLAVGAGILGVLLQQFGAGPFLTGLRTLDGWAVTAAVAVTALTTACCAWRWRLVARRLGVEVGAGTALAAYYRSQFLNATLPGGVLGDVHRGVGHGQSVHAVGRSLRSVAWERSLGQLVQVALTAAVLLVVPSPLQVPGLRIAAAAVLAGLAVLAGVAMLWRRASTGTPLARMPGRWSPELPPPRRRRPYRRKLLADAVHTVAGDVRAIVRVRGAFAPIVLASAAALAGHATIFLIAVRSAGATVPLTSALPLALAVLLVAALPTNLAGWGPREGAAAWAFGAAGLSASQGVTVAMVYGVLALAATLPGAVVLILGRRPGVAHG